MTEEQKSGWGEVLAGIIIGAMIAHWTTSSNFRSAISGCLAGNPSYQELKECITELANPSGFDERRETGWWP